MIEKSPKRRSTISHTTSYRDQCVSLLEATERIIIDVVVQPCCSHRSFARTVAPLAAAAVPSSSGLCTESLAFSWITQGVVDEGFHTNSPHGIEELTPG